MKVVRNLGNLFFWKSLISENEFQQRIQLHLLTEQNPDSQYWGEGSVLRNSRPISATLRIPISWNRTKILRVLLADYNNVYTIILMCLLHPENFEKNS